MLSYYPLEITETTLDPMAIMSGLASAGDMPDLSELDDKVYVNSFLTQIAQGMTVSNNIAQEGYIDYIYEGLDESLYYAISDDTGVTLTDNLFTTVRTKDAEGNALTEVRSLSLAERVFYGGTQTGREVRPDVLSRQLSRLGDQRDAGDFAV